MMSTKPQTPQLNWIRITAPLTGAIALFGLLGLMAQKARAADPNPAGLQSGARPLGGATPGTMPGSPTTAVNPYVGGTGGKPNMPLPQAGGSDFFDEEDEEWFDTPPPGGWGSGWSSSGGTMGAGGNSSAGASAGSPPSRPPQPGEVPDPRRNRRGIEVGGEPPGGVIPSGRVKPIRVDTESGEGSRDLITDFNYPDVDIMDLAKTMGKLTGKNFILDKDVKGRVTIISNSKITVADAWKAFLTALDINQFTLLPSGKYIRIIRKRDAREKQIRTYTTDHAPESDALITRVFSLKYVEAEEMSRVLRQFMPPDARIIAHQQTNTIIMTDTGSNLTKIAQMLAFLDVESYDAGIEVIPVKFASAVELAKLIDTLIPGTSTAKAGAGAPPPAFGGGRAFSSRRTKEGGIINTIIADERTNNLIVHANGKGSEQVKELVAKLDKRLPAQIGGGRIRVVYLQFADAEQMATSLNALATQSNAPKPASGTGTGLGVNPTESALFEGQIKVTADKATNSLLITASNSDFVTVQRVISRLDIPRDQVYAEVVIMETSLARDFSFSAGMANPKNRMVFDAGGASAEAVNLFANPASMANQKGIVLPFASKGTTTLSLPGAGGAVTNVAVPNLIALIKLLQTNASANVLATPQIMTLDNEEATFDAAESVPVPQNTVVPGGTVQTNFTKERIALTITLKPQINKWSNFVKLNINAKVADFSSRVPAQSVNGVQAFATTERNAKTNVVVADSDTVVLGGLVRDKRSETVSKVPLLGDIPVLGWLFKSTEIKNEKTNLLIFITPQIIRPHEKIRALLDKKLRERDKFIEQHAGGDDPMRSYRDDMIRSLPDVSKLSQSQRRAGNPDEPSDQMQLPESGAATEATPSPALPAGPVKAPDPAAVGSPMGGSQP